MKHPDCEHECQTAVHHGRHTNCNGIRECDKAIDVPGAKQCPHCSHRPRWKLSHRGEGTERVTSYHIACGNCGCETLPSETPEIAIEGWNERLPFEPHELDKHARQGNALYWYDRLIKQAGMVFDLRKEIAELQAYIVEGMPDHYDVLTEVGDVRYHFTILKADRAPGCVTIDVAPLFLRDPAKPAANVAVSATLHVDPPTAKPKAANAQ